MSDILGYVDFDRPTARNERVMIRCPAASRANVRRERFVRIEDTTAGNAFLGRIISGPFFPEQKPGGDSAEDLSMLAEIEVQGELVGGRPVDTSDRPSSGSVVRELTVEEVRDLLGCAGDMLMGTLSGRPDLEVALVSNSKNVLPRNIGIFGTVGSGKSNTAQVLIEEAASRGWAVIVLDVEGEYVNLDEANIEETQLPALQRAGRPPEGVADFHVRHPASCASERADSRPFTLRLADFDVHIVAELVQATMAERNALLDCVDHFQSRTGTKMVTTEAESMHGLLDPSPNAKLPYTLRALRDRANDRSSRSTEQFDYLGLSAKLLWLMRSGAFDQQEMPGLDVGEMLKPGRVTVIDVSVANDTVKNLSTADMLRKVFAHKIAKADSPPTLLMIEEAHSFISKENAHTMRATLQMLRNVTRRGRKRWLATAFVSQQPGHLPAEIFELCNTRIVHTLRSMHNLEALMTTTSDIAGELWARCPLLGTGEAIVSSPQLKRPVVVSMRPARSKRKFVR